MTSVLRGRCVWQGFVIGLLVVVLPFSPPARADQTEAVEVDPDITPTVKLLGEPVEVPDADAETEAEMKPYSEKIVGPDITFDMVPIPGGEFVMGSPEDEEDRDDEMESPQRKVRISPFWMGKCEVTWEEFEQWSMGLDLNRRKVLKIEPTERDTVVDALTRPTMPYTDMSFEMGKDGRPAICMTQLAAKMYCKWLSMKTGRYYRLPTEAEWEYACRAGTTGPYSCDPDELDDHAWHFDNSDERYQPVGQKKPNPWGLHDMHGNVCEWVLDPYTPYKKATELLIDPLVEPKKIVVPDDIFGRCIRGGSWDCDPDALRSAARRGSEKYWNMQDPQIPQSIWYHTDADFVGFRVVRPLNVPTPEESMKYEPEEDVIREYKKAHAGKR